MTRDMTRRQFYAALERNGFGKPILMWVSSKDNPNISYSMLFTIKGKICRRETLAHLIARREQDRAKAAK